MKLLFDFFPVVLFVVVFKMHDDPQGGFMTATAAFMVATATTVPPCRARKALVSPSGRRMTSKAASRRGVIEASS